MGRWLLVAALVCAAAVRSEASEELSRIQGWDVGAFNGQKWYEETRENAVGEASRGHIAALQAMMRSTLNPEDLEMLGVSLLHKHFDLDKDERLVEVIEADHTSITTPARYDNPTSLVPYQFALLSGGRLQPLEYVFKPDAAVKKFVDKFGGGTHDQLIKDLHGYLCMHNLTQVYGIAVSHRQTVAAADPHGRQVESSNLNGRWQRIRPFNKQTAKEKQEFEARQKAGLATNTFWPASHNGGPLECDSHCTAHCGVHCGVCCTVH